MKTLIRTKAAPDADPSLRDRGSAPFTRKEGGGLKGCRIIVMAVLLAVAAVQGGLAADGAVSSAGRQFLDQWLQRQAEIGTWSADVVQIRRLKALASPLQAKGRVWFKQPNQFRWQLGDPPSTIALRTDDTLLIAYPPLKRVERFALGNNMDPRWRYVMALLDVGFPSDPAAFYAAYDLIGASRRDDTWRFELQPSAAEARQLLETVRLDISADDGKLQATELQFPDGSIMRNEFHDLQYNPELPADIFDWRIPKDYKVVQPLQETGGADSGR